jgi:hypothetical protein
LVGGGNETFGINEDCQKPDRIGGGNTTLYINELFCVCGDDAAFDRSTNPSQIPKERSESSMDTDTDLYGYSFSQSDSNKSSQDSLSGGGLNRFRYGDA